MYKVGDQRKLHDLVPGELHITIMRAESDIVLRPNNPYMYNYCTVKFKGHDTAYSRVVKKQFLTRSQLVLHERDKLKHKTAPGGASGDDHKHTHEDKEKEEEEDHSEGGNKDGSETDESQSVGGSEEPTKKSRTTTKSRKSQKTRSHSHSDRNGGDGDGSTSDGSSGDDDDDGTSSEEEEKEEDNANTDPQGPKIMPEKATASSALMEFTTDRTASHFILAVPAYGYEDVVQLELWDTDEPEDTSNFMNTDVLLGSTMIPIPWVLNGFGIGRGADKKAEVITRFNMSDAKSGYDMPFELEVRLSYESFYDSPDRAEQMQLRWTTFGFQGSYRLVRNAAKTSILEDLYQALEVPFVIRKVEELQGEEKLEIQMKQGGNGVRMITQNEFWKEDTAEMKIDACFQSVKTFRGTVVEKRLYWDFASMGKVVAGESYPTPVLMMVTRMAKKYGEVVEAWDVSRDGKVLTHLGMIEDMDLRYRRTYVRIPDPPTELPNIPATVTKPGLLTVAVVKGEGLGAENVKSINAYCVLRFHIFDNDDTRCSEKRESDNQEVTTRSFAGESNPEFNQKFQFTVRSGNEMKRHYVLSVSVYNKGSASDQYDTLLGSLRIPVPWLYNGFGSGLGPYAFASFQAPFRLMKGLVIDPTQRITYAGGIIHLALSYYGQD